MIDRNARDKMVEAIEAYMDEKIGAFEFDERIMNISCGNCKDIAVRRSVDILWYLYDDLTDHKIVANKECWNLLHRILLLLKSDVEMNVSRQVTWSVTQIVALLCLLAIPVTACVFQGGWPYPVCWACAGVFSFVIFRHRDQIETDMTKEYKEHYDSFPFQSWLEIFQAAKSVPGFHKKKLTREICKRKIRSSFFSRFMNITIPGFVCFPFVAVAWFAITPLVLVYQLFPVCNLQYNIKL